MATAAASLLRRLMLLAALLPARTAAEQRQPLAAAAPLPIAAEQCGRTYEGIGALLNSDAPWLTAYPPKQLAEILDILFLPQWAAAMQVLKLEIGGDGHSTINTESSHMHTEHDPPSFRRGWILQLLREALRRNPHIKVGGLAWSWPNWTKGSVEKKVRYLTAWVQGLRSEYNVYMRNQSFPLFLY
jgi:galactosylceramidase